MSPFSQQFYFQDVGAMWPKTPENVYLLYIDQHIYRLGYWDDIRGVFVDDMSAPITYKSTLMWTMLPEILG